jgi:transcriptional regulator with XRE-family HTH domain
MSSRKSLIGIGARIKAVRIQNGLPQHAFAKSIGIAQGYLSELETGVKTPSETLLIALSYSFEIGIEWLMSGKGQMAGPKPKQTLDLEFMKEIIETAEAVFEQEQVKFPPRKKAELLVLLYETMITDEANHEGAGRKSFMLENINKFIRLAS